MSYITQAELRRDSASLRAVSDLLLDATRDEGHRLVWTLFAGDPAARRDFLFHRSAPFRYIIVSTRPPQDTSGLWRLQSRPYDLHCVPGDRLAFALRANPTQSVRAGTGGRGKRVDAISWAATGRERQIPAETVERRALEWLRKREEGMGVRFAAGGCRVTNYRQASVPRKAGPAARLALVDFHGELVVQDAMALRHASVLGVGHARAYGCGLLLLRPVAAG